MEIQSRIAALRAEINRHQHLYYVLNTSEGGITDAEYDALFRELQGLEERYPQYDDPCSPTKRIGGLVPNQFTKVQHLRKMLSLDNAFSAQEVLDFFEPGAELMLEPKIDGLSLKLVYKEGKLQQAVTRGNGTQGDDVTANAKTIFTLPLVLEEAADIEVTGEVYMTYSVFNRLNEELAETGDEQFANTRNAASGTLKLKDSQEVARRSLSFVAHGCFTEFEGVETQLELIDLLETLGFQSTFMLPVNDSCETVARVVSAVSLEQLAMEIARADERRKFLNLATDGLVFKLNSLAKQRELGEGTRSPNWGIAYKFPPERKPTTLLGITLQVGKTGKVTPVAELQAVSLSGTVVQRASLCNQDEIARLGVNVGDVVLIEKSAEIIPKVVGLAKAAPGKVGHYKLPQACPCCGEALTRPEGRVDTYCTNPDCDDQIFARLVFSTGKQALDIDGCGEVLVRELMQHGVRKLSHLFALQDLSFLKQAARARFNEGREAAKKAPFWRKLHAMNIEGIGSALSQDIAARWPSVSAICDQLGALETLLGPVDYESFLNWLDRDAQELEDLDKLGFKMEAEITVQGPLTGKVFVVTGTLSTGGRDDIMRRIEKAGGIVKANVSRKVHFLVKGEDAGTTKTKAAQRCGVAVISEQELYRMMGEAMPVRQPVQEEY